MTNETTASQPKSIGDDTQFQELLVEYWATTSSDCKINLVAYIDNFLAPAAQASATIQEPVMVAEPVVKHPISKEWSLKAAQAEQDSGVAGIGAGAAPMVADPAGVALLDSRFLHSKEIASDEPKVDSTQLYFWRCGWNAYRDALAATVKAVPSEALDAARYRFLRDQNIFQEVGSFSPYAVRGQTMEMLDGEELDKAVDSALAAPLADNTGGGE